MFQMISLLLCLKLKQKFLCDDDESVGSTLTKRVVISLELLFHFKEIVNQISTYILFAPGPPTVNI